MTKERVVKWMNWGINALIILIGILALAQSLTNGRTTHLLWVLFILLGISSLMQSYTFKQRNTYDAPDRVYIRSAILAVVGLVVFLIIIFLHAFGISIY